MVYLMSICENGQQKKFSKVLTLFFVKCFNCFQYKGVFMKILFFSINLLFSLVTHASLVPFSIKKEIEDKKGKEIEIKIPAPIPTFECECECECENFEGQWQGTCVASSGNILYEHIVIHQYECFAIDIYDLNWKSQSYVSIGKLEHNSTFESQPGYSTTRYEESFSQWDNSGYTLKFKGLSSYLTTSTPLNEEFTRYFSRTIIDGKMQINKVVTFPPIPPTLEHPNTEADADRLVTTLISNDLDTGFHYTYTCSYKRVKVIGTPTEDNR